MMAWSVGWGNVVAEGAGVARQGGPQHPPAGLAELGDGLGAVEARHHLELHVPLGQGAGLVEAQHVHPTERLERPRPADDGVALRQPSRGRELCGGGDEWQSLRDGGHGEAGAGGDQLTNGDAAEEAHADHARAGTEHDRHDAAGEVDEPGLDAGGGTALGDQVEHAVGLHRPTRRDDHGAAISGGDVATGVHHRRALGERRAWGRADVLLHREGLPGEGRLVDLE